MVKFKFLIPACTSLVIIFSLERSQRLDEVLDSEHGGVPLHLGQIADSMSEWEGSVADQLGLGPADVAAIKQENSKLNLQV